MAFSGSVMKFVGNLIVFGLGRTIESGSFWKVLPDQTIGVLVPLDAYEINRSIAPVAFRTLLVSAGLLAGVGGPILAIMRRGIGCASSSEDPAKPDRMAGGTEAILRFPCLYGHRAPGSFPHLLWPLPTPTGSLPAGLRADLETVRPSMSASLPFPR